MYVIVRLYSNKRNEINNFLKSFFNETNENIEHISFLGKQQDIADK